MRKYTPKPLFITEVSADLIWSSAAYAFRINGGYARDTDLHLKYNNDDNTTRHISEECRVANQILAHYAIMHPEIMSPEDHRQGKDMLAHFSGLIFKGLSMKLNDFEKAVLQAVERKDWNAVTDIKQHFGIVCSLPKSYSRDVARQVIESRISDYNSQHVGNVKERLQLNIKVLRNIYSGKWETNYITAVTDNNEVLFFAYREQLEIEKDYSITGTVKAHRNEGQTQLNRVKVK